LRGADYGVSALVPSHSERRQQEGREAVERTTAQLRQDGLDVEGVALPGEADEVIIKLAEEKGAQRALARCCSAASRSASSAKPSAPFWW
jgi:hypothetical protein